MPMRAAMVTAVWSPTGIALLLIPCGSKKFWEKSGISPIPSALFLFILQQFYISVLLLLSNYTLHFYIHANSTSVAKTGSFGALGEVSGSELENSEKVRAACPRP
jgi:hypothetical protein